MIFLACADIKSAEDTDEDTKIISKIQTIARRDHSPSLCSVRMGICCFVVSAYKTKSPHIHWRAIVAIFTVDLWSYVTMRSLFPINKSARFKCTWKPKVGDLQNTTVSVQNVVELLDEKNKKVKSKCGRQVIIFRKESLHTSYSHSFENHHLYSLDITWNAFNKAGQIVFTGITTPRHQWTFEASNPRIIFKILGEHGVRQILRWMFQQNC